MEDLISQLLSHVRGIWRYRWHAVAVSWLVAVFGWTQVYTMDDEYQTSARVFVDTQTILKPLLSGMTSVPNVEQQVAIMSRTLLSRPNVERVIRMVDMDIRATTAREHERQIENLMSTIRINGTTANDIYTITYRDKDARTVRDVVQSLLTIFVEGSFKGKRSDSQKAVQFIDEQIKNYEDRLVAAENMVKEFKLRNSSLLPRQGVDYGAQVAIAFDQLSAARLELLEAEQARAAIRAEIVGDVPMMSVEAVRPLSVANPELDARIAAVDKNLDALRMQYTELHPDIVAARRLLSQLEARKVEEARSRVRDGDPGRNYSPMLLQLKVALTEADAKVAAMQARVQEFTARHVRLVAQSNAVPEVESQLAQLNRDYEINKDNYEKLIGRREAAKLSGDLSSTTEMMSFKIIDPPTMPFAPIGPNRLLFYSAVMIAALLAGPGIALLVSQARPVFLGPGEMRENTGLHVLGTVSMNWTDAERIKRRRGQYLFFAALALLAVVYAAMMAAAL
ncbi:XrtA system polysaccharide chain length determinant [Massilia cavernae]|uniref:Chain length-determining protein n=1 Tax=Massilia cavernae TaxID=2320864 RepID=A0A418Y8D3_9BURK|nr:XrtA system polysaccharide chain length determinant [Massilia cavernae]RJG27622.1 chain length-determining protein [Massilia cavernae]